MGNSPLERRQIGSKDLPSTAIHDEDKTSLSPASPALSSLDPPHHHHILNLCNVRSTPTCLLLLSSSNAPEISNSLPGNSLSVRYTMVPRYSMLVGNDLEEIRSVSKDTGNENRKLLSIGEDDEESKTKLKNEELHDRNPATVDN